MTCNFPLSIIILLLEILLQMHTQVLVWLIYLSSLSVYSVVNKMFALKGENNCKYKHGEVHLELEQTCFSDTLLGILLYFQQL